MRLGETGPRERRRCGGFLMDTDMTREESKGLKEDRREQERMWATWEQGMVEEKVGEIVWKAGGKKKEFKSPALEPDREERVVKDKSQWKPWLKNKVRNTKRETKEEHTVRLFQRYRKKLMLTWSTEQKYLCCVGGQMDKSYYSCTD